MRASEFQNIILPKHFTTFAYSPLLGPLVLLILSKVFSACVGGSSFESSEQGGPEFNGLHVPEGFVIEAATAPGMVAYPMFATLDDRGRLFVMESSGETTSTEDVLENPTFKILLLEDENADGVFDKRTVFADKIPYPMGGTFFQGSFYATAPPDLIRFTDTNDDGVADEREVILTGWTLNHNAATLSGPFPGPDGWMYMCDARRGFDITTKEGTQLKGKGARIWRCRPDGTGLEWISGGGFDNTIEMIFMPSGETIGTMTYFTDPKDGFRDALMHWVEGGVYPKPFPVIQQDGLKMTGELMPVMTTLARVSPSGLMRYRSDVFGDTYHGNLFSAQFNTGRVMRHIISAEGGTFRTEEEVFMWSDGLDSHPTDVLEDADGSLLVVNTGGWFIAGCPLSVVAKADIHGGIFRVRKKGAPPIEDPWGKSIDVKTLSAEAITELLDDPRIAVRDKAIEELVLLGEKAVGPLKELFASSDNEEIRTAAVFALYRINTPEALAGILPALHDNSAMVRTAAARVAGLEKDIQAFDALVNLVKVDSGAVKRQAATALGQLGDKRATVPLLEAAANADDRFIEHAIIYSLITLENIRPLAGALDHSSENVRNAAMITLDQIENSPLTESDVVPFLNSSAPKLQNTAVRVLSHHPDWSQVVINYLTPMMKEEALSDQDKKVAKELLMAFSQGRRIQNFVSASLANARAEETRNLLLSVIRQHPMQELPQVWVTQLANLLKGKNAETQSKVLDLIQSRGLPVVNNTLEDIFQNGQNTKAFRLKALQARIVSQPELSDEAFDILLRWMRSDEEPPVRHAAVTIAAQADLNDAQLLTLAKEVVADAETFLLPSLVSAFEGNGNEAVGLALVSALNNSPERLENLSLRDVEKLFKSFSPTVQEKASPLLDMLASQQATRLSTLEKFEQSLTMGDVAEGRKLFFGKGLCANCHGVSGQGGDFGPDLTNIGDIRSQHDLLEAILYPSASFSREYETVKVNTHSAAHTGIIKEQLPETLALETGPGVIVRIPRNEITTIETQNISLMPPGLDKQLTTGEMSDLMAYLLSLPEGMGRVGL